MLSLAFRKKPLNFLSYIKHIAVKFFILIIQLRFMPLICNEVFGNFITCMFF